MLLKEKGKKDAEPVSFGWDEAQAAIAAGTHVPVNEVEADKPDPEPAKASDKK